MLMAPRALAQPRGNMPLVGMLVPGAAAVASNSCIINFQQGLCDLGYVEGQAIRLEYGYAAWQLDRLPALATELVQFPVEVIFARGLARPAGGAVGHGDHPDCRR
jgi:putative ABC transport system substrate-binding protein